MFLRYSKIKVFFLQNAYDALQKGHYTCKKPWSIFMKLCWLKLPIYIHITAKFQKNWTNSL